MLAAREDAHNDQESLSDRLSNFWKGGFGPEDSGILVSDRAEESRVNPSRERLEAGVEKSPGRMFPATAIRPDKIERGRRIARSSDAELEDLLVAAMDRVLIAIDRKTTLARRNAKMNRRFKRGIEL